MMVAVLTNGHQNTTIYDKTELTCIEKLRFYIFLCIIFALMYLLNLIYFDNGSIIVNQVTLKTNLLWRCIAKLEKLSFRSVYAISKKFL